MENSTKTIRIISREDYYKLKSYQNLHNMILIFLDSLEEKTLEITGELDKNNQPYWGGYSADLLNTNSEQGILDVLKILGIEVEKENKVIENKKTVGKVNGKKFKSGSWQKDKKLDVSVVIKDRLSLHFQNDEFLDENGVSLFEGKKLSQEELDIIMKIGMDMDDSGAMG